MELLRQVVLLLLVLLCQAQGLVNKDIILESESCTGEQIVKFIAQTEGVDTKFVDKITLDNNFMDLKEELIRYSNYIEHG